MTGRRASVFEDEIDVSDFVPKAPEGGAGREQVKAVSEPASFRSREPVSSSTRKEPRRHRTGRNVQLNLKVRQQDADAFYALADEHGWVLGETFQKAIEALTKAATR